MAQWMPAQQECSLLLPMRSFSGLLYPGPVLPALPPPPSPLSATSPPCLPRQGSIWGGGLGIRVASPPPGSHWPAGLLTRLWLAVPIPISHFHWLWSLSAVCGLDTSKGVKKNFLFLVIKKFNFEAHTLCLQGQTCGFFRIELQKFSVVDPELLPGSGSVIEVPDPDPAKGERA